jgi:hypothetical protein
MYICKLAVAIGVIIQAGSVRFEILFPNYTSSCSGAFNLPVSGK